VNWEKENIWYQVALHITHIKDMDVIIETSDIQLMFKP